MTLLLVVVFVAFLAVGLLRAVHIMEDERGHRTVRFSMVRGAPWWVVSVMAPYF